MIPPNDPKFAILPPDFKITNDEEKDFLNKSIDLYFPVICTDHEEGYRLRSIVKFALASVIFHSDWLKTHMPLRHRLFQTPLFTGNDVEKLKQMVHCNLAKVSDDLQATGAPSTVKQSLQIKELQDGQKQILDAVSDLKGNVSEYLRTGLNDYALIQGHLTHDTVTTIIQSHLQGFEERITAAVNQSKNN